MSSMKPCTSKFESVDSIVHYLQEPSPSEVVSSSTTSSIVGSTRVNNRSKATKKQKKEKELTHVMNATQTHSTGNIQVLSSGRVKYGPITVNPRKQPSKTLFTGRRSKYEPLCGDEEEKRRVRRERNRVAATKCREKRENVLDYLENEYNNEVHNHTNICQHIAQLEQRKQYLQSLLSNHLANGPAQQINPPPPQQPYMIFGNPTVLTSTMETSTLPIPPHQLQNISNNEEAFSNFLQPTPLLTNSTYNNTDPSNYFCLPDQQSQQQMITMNSSSLERLIDSLQSPTSAIDNNNNDCSGLYNSAYGSATCAQQHSSSSEDDSLPPVRQNSYVY